MSIPTKSLIGAILMVSVTLILVLGGAWLTGSLPERSVEAAADMACEEHRGVRAIDHDSYTVICIDGETSNFNDFR